MKNVFRKIKKRIHTQDGESIAETLIALLLASLALVMLASMIQSTSSIVIKSKNKMDEYYTANVRLENPDISDPALKLSIEETESTKKYGKIEIDNVLYQENETFSNKPVLAYTYSPS